YFHRNPEQSRQSLTLQNFMFRTIGDDLSLAHQYDALDFRNDVCQFVGQENCSARRTTTLEVCEPGPVQSGLAGLLPTTSRRPAAPPDTILLIVQEQRRLVPGVWDRLHGWERRQCC